MRVRKILSNHNNSSKNNKRVHHQYKWVTICLNVHDEQNGEELPAPDQQQKDAKIRQLRNEGNTLVKDEVGTNYIAILDATQHEFYMKEELDKLLKMIN